MPGSVLPVQAELSNAFRSLTLRAWFNVPNVSRRW